MKEYLTLQDEYINGLDSKPSLEFNIDEGLGYLGPIGDVNIFVGANNSGKSRCLRKIMNCRKVIMSNRVVLLCKSAS